MTPRSAGWIVAMAVVATATASHATPEAEQLFRDGRAAMKRGTVAEACDLFAASQRMEPRVGTLLNLADCQERLGKTASAWETFLAARALAASQGDSRRAAEATRRAAVLEARLGYLVVAVPPAARVAGLVVTRDKVALDETLWGKALSLDAGEYVIGASAPGFRAWSTTATVRDRTRTEIEVTALVVDPAAAAITQTATSATTATTATSTTTAKVPVPPAVIDAPLRAFAVGVFAGATSREDPFGGVRIVGGMPLPRGALRASASALVRHYEDEPTTPPMSQLLTTTVALGGAIDYLWLPVPQLALAAGLGVGFEIDRQNQGRGTDVGGFWALRASPVVLRVWRGKLELGIHIQVARAGDEWTTLMMGGCDVFVH